MSGPKRPDPSATFTDEESAPGSLFEESSTTTAPMLPLAELPLTTDKQPAYEEAPPDPLASGPTTVFPTSPPPAGTVVPVGKRVTLAGEEQITDKLAQRVEVSAPPRRHSKPEAPVVPWLTDPPTATDLPKARRPSKTEHPVTAPAATEVTTEVGLPPLRSDPANALFEESGETTRPRPALPRATLTDAPPEPLAALRALSPLRKRLLIGGGGALLVSFFFWLAAGGGSSPPPATARPARPSGTPGPEKSRAGELIEAPPPPDLRAQPLYLEVAVDAGDGQLRLERREAGLVKLVSVPDAEVVMGGQRLGGTPLHLTAPVGRVQLVFENRDAGLYKPVALEVQRGMNGARLWEFSRGWLEVLAPDGSLVWVDGRALGKVPLRLLSLYEGYHWVEVMFPDKTRSATRVEVVTGMTQSHEALWVRER